MKRAVLIAGKPNKAKALAQALMEKGMDVCVIQQNKQDSKRIAKTGAKVIRGDATKPYVLQEAGIAGYDLAVGVFSRDSDNLVMLELAKKQFQVKRTVSLVSDPKLEPFFKGMGVDKVVCASTVITGLLEQQMMADTLNQMVPVAHGQAELLEISVLEGDKAANLTLEELPLPQGVLVASILKNGKLEVPGKDTRLQAGDELLVIVSKGMEEKTLQELKG